MYSQRPSRSKKILVGSLGILFGLSHLALIQSTVNKKSSLPLINLPVGPYTSYIASVTEKGYTIRYKSHSPKIIETEKQIACIKAEGSGEATGRLAAASITAPITPTLTEIPYVGWLVAGFFNMFGQKQGAEIGGQMARDFQDC